MHIHVLFFAGVREAMGQGETQLTLPENVAVADAWRAVGGDRLSQRVLCAVNETYVDENHVLQDGDIAAFFPPVTGG